MGSVLKDELIKVEGLIKDACPAFDVNGMSCKEKDYLRALLMERKHLLNRMLLCTPAEVARMKDVNARLFDLTTRLHEKTYSLYRALLQASYDPDFDDDIMIEGRLTYIVDSWDDVDSVLSMAEDEEYGSDFKWMMGLIYSLSEMKELYACARTFTSYNPKDRPDMTANELHLTNELDDGQSWNHHGIFKDICVCHAIYSLTDVNLFSYPDVLRMNDFWCEVTVTHQLLMDLKGERYSCILDRANR